MRTWTLIVTVLSCTLSWPSFVLAQSGTTAGQQPGFQHGGFLGPYKPNAYGPGIHSDATGRPFSWRPQWGASGFPDPTLSVRPNALGPGIGMDQFGRPVRRACPPGWAGPC